MKLSGLTDTESMPHSTRNAANSTLHSAEIGTLEAGKLADIVIVDGDPMRDSDALLHVVTTIKGGQVVFEKKN